MQMCTAKDPDFCAIRVAADRSPKPPESPPRVDPCTALVRETTFQATRLFVLLGCVGTWSLVAAQAAFF